MLEPDEWGCYDCVWRTNFTCEQSGYDIKDQDGPPCARYKQRRRYNMQQDTKKTEEQAKKDKETKLLRPQSYHVNVRSAGACGRL